MIDCRLFIDGTQFADTGEDLEADSPTALADLDLIWGRSTTVDQPEPATCRATILDRSGGSTFLAALPVGARFDVWAEGDISTGAATDVAVDGSFEALPLGPVIDRIAEAASAEAFVTDAVAYEGVQSIDLAGGSWAHVPPAAFGPIGSWDSIPRLQLGQTWSWSITVLMMAGTPGFVSPYAYDSPQSYSGVSFSPAVQFTGTGDWVVVSGSVTVDAAHADRWLGLYVTASEWVTWADAPGTWASTPGSWVDWETLVIDALTTIAPASGLMRDVLVFSGRVTDLSAAVDDAEGTMRLDVTATDQLADLQNRYVGDEPWPSEALSARVTRVLTAAAVDVDVRYDDPLQAAVLSWRDVDNQPVGGLFSEWAAGLDAVLWSATHATTGPYLWFENPGLRQQLAQLALEGGIVVIITDDPNRAPGRTVLSGCDLPVAEVTWTYDVSDVITRVDASWLEQTLDTEGNQQPTERTVQVRDAPAEASYGARRMGVSTPLTTAAAATDVANSILVRTRQLQWRVEALEWDLGRFPPEVTTDPGSPAQPGYLSTAVGQLSTPDTADMAITGPVRLTCKVNPDYPVGVEGTAYFAAQWGSSPTTTGSWFWAPRSTGLMWGRYDAAGVRADYTGMNLTELQTHLIRGQDCYIGLDIRPSAGTVTGIRSSDGVTWTPVRTTTTSAFTVRDSPESLAVGALTVPTPVNPPARLYWAQMETLDSQGNVTGVVWRFDASEVPALLPPVFSDTLDTDSNADGIPDGGWLADGPTGTWTDPVRTVVAGHFRVSGAAAAAGGFVYGIRTATNAVPVTASQAYSLSARASGAPTTSTTPVIGLAWYTAAGAYISSAQLTVNSPTTGWIGVSATAPGTAATAMLYIRLVPGTTPNGTNPVTFDVYEVRFDRANQSYTDPRGRTWTLTNAAAITPAVPAVPPSVIDNRTVDALDLLDGTTRLGRGLIISDADYWPTEDTDVGLYLDGGTYRYDGAWRLGLYATPMAGLGSSAAWASLDPTWRWDQMDPEMEWADLWGVAGPITIAHHEEAA